MAVGLCRSGFPWLPVYPSIPGPPKDGITHPRPGSLPWRESTPSAWAPGPGSAAHTHGHFERRSATTPTATFRNCGSVGSVFLAGMDCPVFLVVILTWCHLKKRLGYLFLRERDLLCFALF